MRPSGAPPAVEGEVAAHFLPPMLCVWTWSPAAMSDCRDAYLFAVAQDGVAGGDRRQSDLVAARDRLRSRQLAAVVEAHAAARFDVGDDDGDVVSGIDPYRPHAHGITVIPFAECGQRVRSVIDKPFRPCLD